MKVIKFGAMWCSGCLVMKPRWAEIEREYPWLQTEFYDYDQDKSMVNKYDINKQLPVAVFVDEDDNEFLRLSGEIDKEKLVETILANRNR